MKNRYHNNGTSFRLCRRNLRINVKSQKSMKGFLRHLLAVGEVCVRFRRVICSVHIRLMVLRSCAAFFLRLSIVRQLAFPHLKLCTAPLWCSGGVGSLAFDRMLLIWRSLKILVSAREVGQKLLHFNIVLLGRYVLLYSWTNVWYCGHVFLVRRERCPFQLAG